MSHALTEVATFTAAVVVPDPGNPVRSNDIVVACQSLANRTQVCARKDVANAFAAAQTFNGNATFNGTVTCNGTAIVDDLAATTIEAGTVTAGTVAITGTRTRLLNSAPIVHPDYWTRTTSFTTTEFATTAANENGGGGAPTDEKAMLIALDEIPHGAIVTQFVVRVMGATSHVALPAHPIKVQFVSQDIGGTEPVLASQVDGTTPVGSYVVFHDLTVPVASVHIDRSTKRYWLRIINEWGTNHVTDGNYIGNISVTFSDGEAE